jgi:hypothetical protein
VALFKTLAITMWIRHEQKYGAYMVATMKSRGKWINMGIVERVAQCVAGKLA